MRTVYIPDGTEEKQALERTTHLCIAAHEDDIEFMAYAPIAEYVTAYIKRFESNVRNMIRKFQKEI